MRTSRSTLIALLAAVIAAVVAFAGCARNPTKPLLYVRPAPTVDPEAAWSNDGKWIVFRRAFFSSYGPPGLYIISASGGTPRFLMPANFFYPKDFAFSPDDRYLVADGASQIILVDVAAGAYWQLFYAENGAKYPDWSPDGRSILYLNLGDRLAPVDSGGVHVFELGTREDRRIMVEGHRVYADFPKWTPDGQEFVAIEAIEMACRSNVVVVRADGSSKAIFPAGACLDYFRRYARPDIGVRGFVFTAGRLGQLFVNADGTNIRQFPWVYKPIQDFISPDGRHIAFIYPDPTDSLVVLFVKDTDDLTGASRRQLTYWDPPPSGLTSRPQEPIAGALQAPLHFAPRLP